MKKLLKLGLIVPMLVLLSLSLGVAADSGEQTDETLNKQLNGELAGSDRDSGRASADDDDSDVSQERTLNDSLDADGARRDISERRGRQPRRGQTPVSVADEQAAWKDSSSGKSGADDEMDDEMDDEDEDDDVTPTSP